MITYFEELMQEEQEELRAVIQLLYRQTFLLERKYDKKSRRLVFNKDYRVAERHLPFIREYLDIAGIELKENPQTGLLYIQGENLMGDKLPKLATLYLLVLKIIYDEQMSAASTSSNVYTTLGDLNERLGSFGVLDVQPSYTEKKRALALLKKYQIIEPLDGMEELDFESRLLIYPSVSMVLLGDDARSILNTFGEDRNDDDE